MHCYVDGYKTWSIFFKNVFLSPGLECGSIKDLSSEEEVVKAIKSPLASMQYGSEDFLAELVAQACGRSKLHVGIVLVYPK